ncbi:MAG: 30S ribosomal protein S16 [Actinobacteria bacterium HGW-Actinobacteria-4]|nr:MAG: 30S ribosomal protein S16 [Actinobacteria bacterium HGW-Actinobacteria-4]
MAVKIRLKRFGKKKAPFYRVIVIDSRAKRDGRALEEIGKYHPLGDPSVIEINSDRAQYWLSVGAQPTDQVRKLLTLTGDWGTFKGDKDAKNTVQVAAGKLSPEEQIKKVAADAEKLKAAKAEAKDKAKKEAEAEAKAADEAAKAEAAAAPAEDAAPAAEEAPAADEAAAEEATEAPADEAPAVEEPAAEEAPEADKAEEK